MICHVRASEHRTCVTENITTKRLPLLSTIYPHSSIIIIIIMRSSISWRGCLIWSSFVCQLIPSCLQLRNHVMEPQQRRNYFSIHSIYYHHCHDRYHSFPFAFIRFHSSRILSPRGRHLATCSWPLAPSDTRMHGHVINTQQRQRQQQLLLHRQQQRHLSSFSLLSPTASNTHTHTHTIPN